MESGEIDIAFTKEFIASSREKAIEVMGKEEVESIDETIHGYVEDEEEYDADTALDYLRELFGTKLVFNNYPINSYASSRAKKDYPDDEKNYAIRTQEIAFELTRMKQNGPQ